MHEQDMLKKEEMKKHMKYSKDSAAFIRDCRTGVNSQTWKGELLTLFDFEKEILELIHENKFSIIKKSRQMHMTSLTAAYCAWKMIFCSGYNITILSPRMEGSVRFIEMVRMILQNYSNHYFHWEDEFVKNNKSEILISNGSNIKGASATVNAVRGHMIDMLIIDEAAFVNKLEHIWPAILCCIEYKKGSAHPGSKCIMISTPNGKNVFYEFWNKAVKGDNDFMPIHLDWTANPKFNEGMERDADGEWTSDWYEKMCMNLGGDENMISQELWGKFVDVKKPVSKRINFRLDSDTYDAIMKNLGGDYGISNYVRNLIEKDLKRDE